MKGRMITAFVVLAMAVAACADPGVVGGDDMNQESESVTNDAVSNDPAATGQESATDSGAVSDETDAGDETTAENPATDPADQTAPTAAKKSPLVTNPPKDTGTTSTSSPASGGGTVDPSLASFVDQAKADLAGRLGVDASAITVISAELVEWSDASLGCPKPGMVYAQVPTDGSLIMLSHGGAEYRYHTGGTVYVPFLCE